MSTEILTDEMKALLTIMRHRELVADHLHRLADYFRARAREHDRSKLMFDEISGFTRINATARQHPYGSDEYRESLASEKGPDGCITLHNKRNRHHPEHFNHDEAMNLFDLMEMVIDWKGASETYGNSTFQESLEIQRERFADFDPWQWEVIDEMVAWIERNERNDR